MDARMWHRQATTPPEPMPDPVGVGAFEAMGPLEQDSYWDAVTTVLYGVVVPSVLVHRAEDRLNRIVERNQRRPPGAKPIVTINAPFTVGKSTLVKAWAQGLYRRTLGTAFNDARPTWHPEADVTADWVPQIYITLRAASKIKDINAAILAYLGYPSEGLIRVTTTRVVKVLGVHAVRLLIVDDVHMLNTRHADGRDVLDYLKFLNTELGELGGTLILVGASLHGGPIHLDPQINGRLEKITLTPYEIDSQAGRHDWQTFLKAAEKVLLPYFDTAPTGVFAREHAAHIWRRSQGYVGDTVTLLVESLLDAFDDAAATITRPYLDAVPLSARAAAAEAALTVKPAAVSGRRSKTKTARAS